MRLRDLAADAARRFAEAGIADTTSATIKAAAEKNVFESRIA